MKKINSRIVTLAMLILSACSFVESSPQITTNVPINTATVLAPTDTPQATPTSEQKGLEVVNYESPQKNVNLSDLNLPSEFQLIVQDKSKNIGMLGQGLSAGQQFGNLTDIMGVYAVKVSPSGETVAYISKINGTTYLNINKLFNNKLTSLWKIKIPDNTTILQWTNNRMIAIWSQSDRQSCPTAVALFDASTGKLAYLSSFPTLVFPQDCEHLPALSPTGTKLIYPAWKLYDFETGEAETILPGLKNLDPTLPTLDLKWTSKGFSIINLHENILSYVLSISAENLSSEDVSLKQIMLPGLAEAVIWSSPKWWSLDGNLIGLDLMDSNTDPKDFVFANKAVPTNFYLLDLEASKLFNYHLDRSEVDDKEAVASPDERFLAWTIYDTSSGAPIATKIIDLSNGVTALIKDVEVLGWIRKTN